MRGAGPGLGVRTTRGSTAGETGGTAVGCSCGGSESCERTREVRQAAQGEGDKRGRLRDWRASCRATIGTLPGFIANSSGRRAKKQRGTRSSQTPIFLWSCEDPGPFLGWAACPEIGKLVLWSPNWRSHDQAPPVLLAVHPRRRFRSAPRGRPRRRGPRTPQAPQAQAAAARPGAGREPLRPGQGRAGFGRGHRQVHDRAALRQSVGGLSARFADRSLADGISRPRRRRRGRALDDRADLRLLPQARRDLAARPSPDDRKDRGRPRHPARGDRRRGGAPRPRQAQGRDRRAGRSAQDDTRGRRDDHRLGPARLLLQRGAPFDRARQSRDGHGDGLSPGRLRPADDPKDPRRAHRAHQSGLGAGRPRQAGRLVLPLPQGQDRLRRAAARLAAVLGLLRLPRQQPRLASGGAAAVEGRQPDVLRVPSRRSSTTSTSRCRSSRLGTAPGRSTPTSTRSCSTSGSPCRSPSSAR